MAASGALTPSSHQPRFVSSRPAVSHPVGLLRKRAAGRPSLAGRPLLLVAGAKGAPEWRASAKPRVWALKLTLRVRRLALVVLLVQIVCKAV